jgi:hypothetical protein
LILKKEIIFDTLPFSDHSLKIGHTYRYMYRYEDTYSVAPGINQLSAGMSLKLMVSQ